MPRRNSYLTDNPEDYTAVTFKIKKNLLKEIDNMAETIGVTRVDIIRCGIAREHLDWKRRIKEANGADE